MHHQQLPPQSIRPNQPPIPPQVHNEIVNKLRSKNIIEGTEQYSNAYKAYAQHYVEHITRQQHHQQHAQQPQPYQQSTSQRTSPNRQPIPHNNQQVPHNNGYNNIHHQPVQPAQHINQQLPLPQQQQQNRMTSPPGRMQLPSRGLASLAPDDNTIRQPPQPVQPHQQPTNIQYQQQQRTITPPQQQQHAIHPPSQHQSMQPSHQPQPIQPPALQQQQHHAIQQQPINTQPPPPNPHQHPQHSQLQQQIPQVHKVLRASSQHVIQTLHHEQQNEVYMSQFYHALKHTHTSLSTLQKQIMCGGNNPQTHYKQLQQIHDLAKKRQLQKQQQLLQQQQHQQHNDQAQSTLSQQQKTIEQPTASISTATVSQPSSADKLQQQISNAINSNNNVQPPVDTSSIAVSDENNPDNIYSVNNNNLPTDAQLQVQQHNTDLDLPVEPVKDTIELQDIQYNHINNVTMPIVRIQQIKLYPEDENLKKYIDYQYNTYKNLFWFLDVCIA